MRVFLVRARVRGAFFVCYEIRHLVVVVSLGAGKSLLYLLPAFVDKRRHALKGKNANMTPITIVFAPRAPRTNQHKGGADALVLDSGMPETKRLCMLHFRVQTVRVCEPSTRLCAYAHGRSQAPVAHAGSSR